MEKQAPTPEDITPVYTQPQQPQQFAETQKLAEFSDSKKVGFNCMKVGKDKNPPYTGKADPALISDIFRDWSKSH